MLRIILVTTFIVVNADSTFNSYSPSSNGFKSYDFGTGKQDKYSTDSKYFFSSGSSPGNINSALSSSYPSTSIYSDVNQGESLSSNYENLENSYSTDSQNAATVDGYTRDRAYLTNSDYSSNLSSQSDYPGTSNSQPEFSGRTDYEGSLNDYTESAAQQGSTLAYTVGSSYRGSTLENYPASQEATNVRGFVTSSQGSSPASGFVASPSYPDTNSNRGVYTGTGFKALDISGFRGYHPSPSTREFIGSGKHRGHVTSVSSKYPVYESSPLDGYSGNEVEYTPSYSSSSPHVSSAGNYKRESYNSGGGAPQGGYSSSPGFNFLPGSIKGSYSVTGNKGHFSAYSGGPRETGPSPAHFSGSGAYGTEGIRYIISGASPNPNYASYSSSPSLFPKGHGSAYLSGGFGGTGGSGKIIIIKDSSSSPHSSSSSYPGGHMFSSTPSIVGSFKTTRGASVGNQGATYSYIPSFAGGSSPSYSSRFTSGGHGGGSPYPVYMTAS